jgi:diguanylate cyclase (GGDEF)-like protein
MRGAGQRAIDTLRPGDAVAMIDLDDLKSTNDSLGHAAGDGELVALARHLSAGIRSGDAVARWGGDEFVVVLRSGGDAGVSVVDRLRATSPARFSAGIAVHRAGAGPDTLAAADAALLAAKRAGGSRVVAAQ